MDEKRICIICRKLKDKAEFDIEHIIPESIGNKKLTIDAVCKICNSKLGQKIDFEITNNFISSLARFNDKIKGKSGKVPNPFKQGITKDGRIVYCDNNLNPRYLNSVKFDESRNVFSGSVDSLENGIKEINKKLKRMGKDPLSDKEIKQMYSSAIIKKERPEILFPVFIDFYKIKLGFIKMAYEFMYYINGDDYLKDSQGIKLSNILKDYIYSDIKSDINGIIGYLPKEEHNKIVKTFEIAGKCFFNNERIHSISLFRIDEKMVVNVALFSSMIFWITVGCDIYKINRRTALINPKDSAILID